MRAALLIFCAVCLAYLPSLGNGYVWDDADYLTRNPLVRLDGRWADVWTRPLASPQYYPLVFTAFRLEYRLWGVTPFGYHLVNVLLHAANAAGLWWVLRRLAIPGAASAALLWALHPVQVETVGWISERKNLLALFFSLASLAAYLRWVEARERRYYALALAAFVLALFAKTVACSLPAVILLLLGWRRRPAARGEIVPLLPFFGVGLALGLLTAWLERVHIGARGDEWAFTAGQHLWIAGRDLGFYLAKLAWPDPLLFVYPRWTVPTAWLPQLLVGTAPLLVLAVLWRGRRLWGDGPFVAALVFAGTLFPALGFFHLFPLRYAFVADHFQYIASIAPLTLAAAGAAAGLRRLGAPRGGGTALAAAVLLPLAATTWARQPDYRDAFTLSSSVLRGNPDCWVAHRNLGDALVERGRLDEALREYEEADRLRPDDVPVTLAHGAACERLGRLDGAEADYLKAVRLDPGSATARNDLGALFLRRAQWARAAECLERAVALDPRLPAAHYNLAVAYHRQGDLARAVAEYDAALRLDPGFEWARQGRAAALAERAAPR